ncbi:beta-L-arabinofuranosidase domain-containing protein [Pedobacter frigidisoli]|uniref:beta-L-arabinofuranosidase domain-containing protein n=1 Tax=Pedobacter frigidisoli TaxID=2530455 RepID=UPI00292E22AB|nr:beta-L-arabinofuranosidase domain-containing protein [Pedobacter frigidisoli]
MSIILKSLCVTIIFLAVLEVKGQSKLNEFNRLPLKQDVYVQLPIGSIKAKGWLLKQLEQQRDGATGVAEALYPEDDNLGKNTDWLGGKGNGWERVPYYVKGLVALAYTLDDASLKAKAQKYIEWTLNSQQQSGLFGPEKMKDWWPRMPMMYALQSYFEATADKRVIPFLTRYFNYELANLDADPLKEWGKSRAGDNMEIALWLYNKTGDPNLLKLVEKLNQQAYPWIDIYSNNQFYFFGDDFQPKHMVNVAQALKYPVIYAQLNETKDNMDAFSKGIEHIMNDHGQPQGLGSGTEFLAGRNSTAGVETCTVVEWMQSLETAARVIHDSSIGDQLEKVAFNALPAQFSSDFKNHSYYTLPNQVMSAHGELGFNQDYSSGIVSSPYSGYGCCRYNMHMGWPYFVKNAVAATPDKGLALITYGPMEIETFVENAKKVKIAEDTNYPFEEQIRLKFSITGAAVFPLILRIPSWCNLPLIKINGAAVKGVKQGKLLKIKRQWKDGDQLVLNFPMHIATKNQVNNSVSIERGPLVYALEIMAENRVTKTHALAGFADYEIYPKSAWNYGLTFDKNDLAHSIQVKKGAMPANPFIAESSPVKLKAQAKKISSWSLAPNKLVAFDVPVSPVFSNEKTEEVTLVPYGSENIRLSLFPTIGQPKKITGNLVENFDRGMPDNWVFYGGGWFYKDGTIQCASNAGSGGYGMNGSKYVANNTNFKDFSYEADIRITTEGDAGLMFRVSYPAIGADAYEGYYVGLNANSGQIQIGKAVNQKWVPLATAKYPIKLNTNHRIKVVAKGTKIEVFLDNMAGSVASVTDGEYHSGCIGLRTYKALASFDSLKINSL